MLTTSGPTEKSSLVGSESRAPYRRPAAGPIHAFVWTLDERGGAHGH
jgi:hypothetical protein